MTTSTIIRLATFGCALVVAVAAFWLFTLNVHAADDWVLATNETAGVTRLSRDKVRAVWSGRLPKWANGEQVVLILPPRESPPLIWLCEGLLEMPQRVYRRFLLEQVYRGSARAPIQARSLAEVAQFVEGVRGAISVLPRAMVRGGSRAVEITH